MKLSQAVSPILREYGLSEKEVYAVLRQCGSDTVDYDFGAFNAKDWLSRDAAEWGREKREMLESAGVRACVSHVTGFSHPDEATYIEKAVCCAGAIGADRLVVPLLYTENNTRREYEEFNLAYLERLLKAAREAGVTLLIEHAGSWLKPHYSHHAIELMHLIEKLGEPENLKVNLNVGHMGVAEIKPYTEIKMLGELIRNVDLSDNFGGMPLAVHPEREALGLAPMMGYIDYDRVMQGLCDINYRGDFNLRIDIPRVFPKNSPYCSETPLGIMPLEITKRLQIWSRRVAEHMLRTYGLL